MTTVLTWSITYSFIVVLFLLLFIDWNHVCYWEGDNEENTEYVIV
jgi:hypothetical protein